MGNLPNQRVQCVRYLQQITVGEEENGLRNLFVDVKQGFRISKKRPQINKVEALVLVLVLLQPLHGGDQTRVEWEEGRVVQLIFHHIGLHVEVIRHVLANPRFSHFFVLSHFSQTLRIVKSNKSKVFGLHPLFRLLLRQRVELRLLGVGERKIAENWIGILGENHLPWE